MRLRVEMKNGRSEYHTPIGNTNNKNLTVQMHDFVR